MKLTPKQTATLTFTHVTSGKPASLFIAMNPLTGDWLQTHRHGDAETSYYGTEADAVRLADKIIEVSKKKKLTCTVKIGKNSMACNLP